MARPQADHETTVHARADLNQWSLPPWPSSTRSPMNPVDSGRYPVEHSPSEQRCVVLSHWLLSSAHLCTPRFLLHLPTFWHKVQETTTRMYGHDNCLPPACSLQNTFSPSYQPVNTNVSNSFISLDTLHTTRLHCYCSYCILKNSVAAFFPDHALRRKLTSNHLYLLSYRRVIIESHLTPLTVLSSLLITGLTRYLSNIHLLYSHPDILLYSTYHHSSLSWTSTWSLVHFWSDQVDLYIVIQYTMASWAFSKTPSQEELIVSSCSIGWCHC